MAMDQSKRTQLLESLVSAFPGVAYRCLHDENWTLEFVSDGCTELVGYTVEQLVDDREISWADLIHPDDLDSVSVAIEKALSERKPFTCEYRIRGADSSYRQVWERGRGVFADNGDLTALEGFVADVTDRVEAENALREAQRLEAIGDLAGGIAHDFNNLLMVMNTSVALLRRALETGESVEREIDNIEDAAGRAANLVDQLLSLGKSSSTAHSDLAEHLTRMAPLLRRAVGANIEVQFDLAQDPCLVNIPPGQLDQLIMNLVINARDAMPQGGQLSISAKRVPLQDASHQPRVQRSDEVRLDVADTGVGVEEEKRESLFEPFFTTKGKGTGLGLAVVRTVTRRAGGRLNVESVPGQGTRFTFLFPRVVGDSAGSDLQMDNSPGAGKPLGGELVVLLAEDDDAVRDILAKALRSNGYTVLEARDGEQALALSRRHKGHLHALVTDFQMPRMDGATLAEHLASSRPGLPMLLISGHAELTPSQTRPFSNVLAKPLTAEELGAALAELLNADTTS